MSWYSKVYAWVREYRQRNPVKGWILTKSLNIMVIIQFIFLGYFQVMYLYAVCWQMLECKQQVLFYIFVFEGITILASWSFMATIMTPVAKVPDKFRADTKTDGDLKANTPYNGKHYLPDQSTHDMMMQQMEILQTFCSQRNISTMERDHFGDRIRYCYECCLVKPDRAHHCSSCGFCVLKFDHHCPWINHCVHYGNYKYFLLYLFYSLIFLCWTTVTSLEAFARYFVKAHWVDDLIPFLMIALGILGCICFMYWPLGEMFIYHRDLIVLNETTCEQAKIPRIDGDPKADYNVGTLKNLRQVFGWGFWFFPLDTQVIDGLHYTINYHRKPALYAVSVGLKPKRASTNSIDLIQPLPITDYSFQKRTSTNSIDLIQSLPITDHSQG